MQSSLPMKCYGPVKALDSCKRLLSFPLPLSHDCISRQPSHDVWERLCKCQHRSFIPNSSPESVAPLFFFLFSSKCRQDVNVEKRRVAWQGYQGEGLHLPSFFFAPLVRNSDVTLSLYLELQHPHPFLLKFHSTFT